MQFRQSCKLLLLLCSVPAGALSTANSTTYPIDSQQVTVGGFKCDKIQTARVYYPTDTTQKYPLLAFAHGWTEGGTFVHTNYKDVLESVAAAGYVVIAEESCLDKLDYSAHKADQLRSLDYIKATANFSNRVDWTSKVGVYGHSMGGAASGMNAGDATAVQKYNLGAAVCLHPAQGGQTSHTKIPTFYFSGSADTIVPPGGVRYMYGNAAAPKVFAEITGATHFACQSFENGIPCPHKETATVINWMNCYIKGMAQDCTAAYNVCDGTSPAGKMSACVDDKGSAPPSPPSPPAQKFACKHGVCSPSSSGLDKQVCQAGCS